MSYAEYFLELIQLTRCLCWRCVNFTQLHELCLINATVKSLSPNTFDLCPLSSLPRFQLGVTQPLHVATVASLPSSAQTRASAPPGAPPQPRRACAAALSAVVWEGQCMERGACWAVWLCAAAMTMIYTASRIKCALPSFRDWGRPCWLLHGRVGGLLSRWRGTVVIFRKLRRKNCNKPRFSFTNQVRVLK